MPDSPPDYLDSRRVIAVDTETDGIPWYDGGQPFLVTLSDYDRDYLFRMDSKDDREALGTALDRADEWVFHNATFDLHMLRVAGIIDPDPFHLVTIHDTFLMAKCMFGWQHTPNFKLKTLATVFVDPKAKDAENELLDAMVSLGYIQKRDQQYKPADAFIGTWQAYPEITEAYALYDTRCTYDLYHTLRTKADTHSQPNVVSPLVTYDTVEQPLIGTVYRMEMNGVGVDPAAVDTLSDQYRQANTEALDELKVLTGNPDFKPNSSADVVEWVKASGVEITETTKTGEPRTDKWMLERIANDLPGLHYLFEARQAEKFLSTYVGPLKGRTRAHPNFNQYGAATGRFSSYDPNFQNIPVRGGSEVREVIVPSPGHSLVVADYSSIELRLLAHYMGDERLWQIIDEGDPFLWLGEQVFGTSDPDTWPVERSKLKNGFYALTYGAGGPKLASTIGGGMSAEEGRALARKIKNALGSPYYDLVRRIKGRAADRGFLTTLLGRWQWIPRGDDGHLKDYVGLNYLIQGSAADIMKTALVDVEKALLPYEGRIILTVHDEIVAEVPNGANPQQALDDMCHWMKVQEALAHKGRLTLEVEGKVVQNYGEAK